VRSRTRGVPVGVLDPHRERHSTAAVHPVHLPAHGPACRPPTVRQSERAHGPGPADETPGAPDEPSACRCRDPRSQGVQRFVSRPSSVPSTTTAAHHDELGAGGSLEPPQSRARTRSVVRGSNRLAATVSGRSRRTGLGAFEPVDQLAPRRDVPHLPEARDHFAIPARRAARRFPTGAGPTPGFPRGRATGVKRGSDRTAGAGDWRWSGRRLRRITELRAPAGHHEGTLQ
jgi:hypothetical protein